MSSPAPTIPIDNGPAPFNKPNADIILRSLDGIDLRAHKLILTLASPVFETLFSLPQGEEQERGQEEDASLDSRDNLQIVRVAQNADTLSNLLLFCYPTAPPNLDRLSDVGALLKAAHYYQMEDITAHLRHAILNSKVLETDPLQVYAIACRWGWKEVAERAARETLSGELVPFKYYPEMDDIPAGCLVRLSQFHNRCGETAKNTAGALMKHDVLASVLVLRWPWFSDNPDLCRCASKHGEPTAGRRGLMKHWWPAYVYEAGERLQRKPCKATIMSSKMYPHAAEWVSCRMCMLELADYMNAFNEWFWEKVEEEILKVDLEFKTDT